MQTVILWTEYDGTPETLPEEAQGVLVCRIGARYPDGKVFFRKRVDGVETWEAGISSWGIVVGELWAPWPKIPQGAK